MKENTFITIQSWMRSKLKLSGNELLVYAIIYGYSQDGESHFHGSRAYLADWCGCTVRSIQTVLNNLTSRGLLTKYDNGEYSANTETENIIHGENFSLPEGENFSLNNIDIDNIENNNNFTNVKLLPAAPAKKKNLYEKCLDCIDEFTTNESIRLALKEYLSLRLSMKDKPIYGVNQWKGLLKKLREICGDSADKALDVIDESIARGWATFVNPKEKYQKTAQASQADVHCDIPTEEDRAEKEKFIEQLQREGKQWQF